MQAPLTRLLLELLATLLLRLEELLLLILLDEDTTLLTTELELESGVLLAELPLPSMPKGAGCAAQVLREIQLWLFSQPQPLWVVTQSG